MAIDLTDLLTRHYSTVKNGLMLVDSDTVKWEHDGFGHLTAHFTPKPVEAEKEKK